MNEATPEELAMRLLVLIDREAPLTAKRDIIAQAIRAARLAGWEECRAACKAIAEGFMTGAAHMAVRDIEDVRRFDEGEQIRDAIAALTPPTSSPSGKIVSKPNATLEVREVPIPPDVQAAISRNLSQTKERNLQWDLQAAYQQLRYLWETTNSCPCGARKESLQTHSHVSSCPTAKAVEMLTPPTKEGT